MWEMECRGSPIKYYSFSIWIRNHKPFSVLCTKFWGLHFDSFSRSELPGFNHRLILPALEGNSRLHPIRPQWRWGRKMKGHEKVIHFMGALQKSRITTWTFFTSRSTDGYPDTLTTAWFMKVSSFPLDTLIREHYLLVWSHCFINPNTVSGLNFDLASDAVAGPWTLTAADRKRHYSQFKGTSTSRGFTSLVFHVFDSTPEESGG